MTMIIMMPSGRRGRGQGPIVDGKGGHPIRSVVDAGSVVAYAADAADVGTCVPRVRIRIGTRATNTATGAIFTEKGGGTNLMSLPSLEIGKILLPSRTGDEDPTNSHPCHPNPNAHLRSSSSSSFSSCLFVNTTTTARFLLLLLLPTATAAVPGNPIVISLLSVTVTVAVIAITTTPLQPPPPPESVGLLVVVGGAVLA